jgi:hypothetical protein
LDNEELICELISEQARRCIANKQLGIAAVHTQHLDALVPSLVADFQKRHATLHRAGYEPERRLCAPNDDTSKPSRAAPFFTMLAMQRPCSR